MLPIMAFAKPEYPKDTVDLAGDSLIGKQEAYIVLNSNDLNMDDIINNWRLAHAHPLNTFQMALRRRSSIVDPGAVIAQRSKRRVSIKDKLTRKDDIKLSEMQDIAGCRAIVNSVEQVYEIVKGYKRRYAKHELIDQDDYIKKPKSDGYRSYHLIYRYQSRRPSFTDYNGLKIEIQIRSMLQHCWATAVEVADIFYHEGLKAHRGSPEWRRFFALMGAAIAMREQTRRVPRTPKDWPSLVNELRYYAQDLNVKSRLDAFGQTINVIGESDTRRAGIKHVLLILNPKSGDEQLRLIGFTASKIDEAARQYTLEEQNKSESEDAVLVSVSDASTLRRAYPNYFLDTKLFLNTLDEFISPKL